jgi:transposase InsO family protein
VVTATASGVVALRPGLEVLIEGSARIVEEVSPVSGTVMLQGPYGPEQWGIGRLLGQMRPGPGGEGCGGQRASLDDLSKVEVERLRVRVAHALEAATGFRSGDPARLAPGEPRPEYDPACTTKQQRYAAKAAELARLRPEEAQLLGVEQTGERTLRRLATACLDGGGLDGCIDRRQVRPSPGHIGIDEEITEAITAVRAECLHRSRVSMRTKERMVHQYVREKYGYDKAIPSYWTLRRVWREWFGPGGGRQRYVRSAEAVDTGAPIVILRPGQVIALDTTPAPVKVRDGVFGDPVTPYITLALDVFTRSIVAFRFTLVSDTSVDVGQVLRDVMVPLPMRPGWGQEMAWPYPGLPATIVAELAGYEVAALPFFCPETVTSDHGSVYKNHHIVEVERALGCDILPARAMRPTDKASVERTFGSIRSLLFEYLLGYTGVDPADRGVDPEADAVFTLGQLEHLTATWTVRVWQNRRLDQHAPPWAPDQRHSPNTLFAASLAKRGFALRMPSAAMYYGLLPKRHVTVHRKRGIKINGLWYDGAALDPYSAPRAGASMRASGNCTSIPATGARCSSKTRPPRRHPCE